MNEEPFDAPPAAEELQGVLKQAVNAIRAVRPPAASLRTWQQRDSKTGAPSAFKRTTTPKKGNTLMRRLVTLTTAAAVAVAVLIGVLNVNSSDPGRNGFAEAAEQIRKAKSITWKEIGYDRYTSMDGKRTWLVPMRFDMAYRSPGLERETHLDGKGEIAYVRVTNDLQSRALRFEPPTKEFLLSDWPARYHHIAGPFDAIQKQLKEGTLQWIEKRKTAAGEVNVFRATYDDGRSADYWLDVKTKQLVEWRVPGSNIFDPDTDAARSNRPEEDFSQRVDAGRVCYNIVFDAELDESFFGLEPPASYHAGAEPRRTEGTEQDMIELLGLMADYNDKVFPDQPWVITNPENKNTKMSAKERLAAKEKLMDAVNRYAAIGKEPDLIGLIRGRIVENSFRYLGKGVTLGDKDRIVCWYRLKNAKDPKTYRVVYGDLSIKDVAAEDLPLPVDP